MRVIRERDLPLRLFKDELKNKNKLIGFINAKNDILPQI